MGYPIFFVEVHELNWCMMFVTLLIKIYLVKR